jgi:serine/threonine protein phosphatase PrpC
MDTIITGVSQSIVDRPIPDRQYQLIAASDRGPRGENQDNYLIINAQGQSEYLLNEAKHTRILENWPKEHIRLAVADGMGGHNNGRQAAEAVVLALLELDFQTEPEAFRDALFAIHNKLFSQFHQGARTPGSTLVIADIDPKGNAVIANIGDSRVYLYRENQWELITTDHSQAEFAYRDNEINEAIYKQSLLHNTNRIVQAMIFGSSGIIANQAGIKQRQHIQELRVELGKDIFKQHINPDDVLMLASDGVWSGHESYVSPPPIDTELSHYATQLMDQALKTTRDNTSFLLCL